jgi:hypothetical protein
MADLPPSPMRTIPLFPADAALLVEADHDRISGIVELQRLAPVVAETLALLGYDHSPASTGANDLARVPEPPAALNCRRDKNPGRIPHDPDHTTMRAGITTRHRAEYQHARSPDDPFL